MQATQPQSSSSASDAQSPTAAKSPDYVYFERTTAGFSDDAVPKAKTAQLKLEHFYKIAVEAAIERNTRCVSALKLRDAGLMAVKDVSSWSGS